MKETEQHFEYFNPQSLRLAWERMIRSNGRDVKDYFGIEVYGANLEINLAALSESLIKGKYIPSRPFKYYEPKASRTHRTKTLLNVEDAITYQAIANVIAHKNFDKLIQYNDFVFGSVLHQEVKQGTTLINESNPDFYFFQYYVPLYNRFARSVNVEIEKFDIKYKLETDITGFFDSIPHSKLIITLLKNFQVPEVVTELLAKCLNIWSGTRDSITPGIGIPQGPAASFFLANVLLSSLDDKIISQGFTYYRYMDDIRIYASTENELQESLILIDNYLKGHGLSLNTKKTSILPIGSDRDSDKQELLTGYDNEELQGLTEEQAILAVNELQGAFGEQMNQDIDDQNVSLRTSFFSKDEAILFCWKEILEVENELLQIFIGDYSQTQNKLLINDDFRKELVDKAFRFRNSINILHSFGLNPTVSPKLIPIWIFCIEHIFWKANHFCWNLNQYGKNELVKSALNSLMIKFKHLEWVRYQILSNMALVQTFSGSELKDFFNLLKNESSILVRLGYYQLLVKHLNTEDQLFTSVFNHIKKEKSAYIIQAMSLLKAKKLGNMDLDIIKNWLGL